MKTYTGERLMNGEVVVMVEERRSRTGSSFKYTLRHLQLHSSGFEWGYGGSGPSDLALSLLADYLGEDPHDVLSWANSGHMGYRCEACEGEGFVDEQGNPWDVTEQQDGQGNLCAACNGIGSITPPESMAWRWHQDFKVQVVAAFPRDEGWTLSEVEMDTFCSFMRAREQVGA